MLCVDDDPLLLAGLVAGLHGRFDVTTAENGLEALRLLAESGPFTVILSDFAMPGMDGAQFLERAREAAPDAARILLTGQASLDDVIDVVNQGRIFRFLAKPCPTEVLARTLEDAVDQVRLVTRDRELLEHKLAAMSEQLLQAERLATVGTLAGAVGHELKNMLVVFDCALSAIVDSARLARPPDGEDVAMLESVRQHLGTHATHLLHLGRPGPSGRGGANLCLVVRETLAMLRTAGLLRHVETRIQLPEAIPVAIDRTRLEQVTLNLVKNAVDAMSEPGGRSPVLTVDVQLDAERGEAVWRIGDNGCGIPGDKLRTVFEPYYTTKGRDHGTGLGLFVVKQIVEASGGDIEIASQPGEGTTFTLRIPAASRLPLPRGLAAAARPTLLGPEALGFLRQPGAPPVPPLTVPARNGA